MPQFILKITGFLSPFFIALLMAVGVAMYSGEAMPLRAVIGLQTESPNAIYLPVDRDPIFAYKLMGFLNRKPEILIIGSSRVLNFRSNFLNKQPAAFFNAGFSGMRLREIEAFIDQLDQSNAPQVLIISSDQFWFNSLWNDNREPANISRDEIDLSRMLLTTRRVWQELYGGKVSLQQIFNPYEKVYGNRAIGLDAIIEGTGYKADGSRQTDIVLLNDVQQEALREESIKNYWSGKGHYQRGNIVSQEALDTTERILQKAKALGILVIGYAPPYLPEIYEGMMKSGQYRYLPEANTQLKALYESYGFRYFDYTDATSVGGSSKEMSDGVHPSELLSLRIYIDLVNANQDLLGKYSDIPALEQAITDAPNPHEVFPKK